MTRCIPLFVAGLFATSAQAATFGHIQRFTSPGTNGWSGGTSLSNPGTDGVDGAGDGYLKLTNNSAENFGTKSGAVQYTGDWTLAGITQVTFYLKDVGADQTFSFRLLLSTSSTTWQYRTGFNPPQNRWQKYSVNLTDEANWVRLQGSASLAQVLQNVDKLHFRHDLPEGGAYDREPNQIAGDLGIDNIELGPDCNRNGVPDPQEPDTDGDADGVPAVCDNCQGTFNPNQADADEDFVGDACDLCPSTVPFAAVDATGCPPLIPGDFDRDGDVDLTDFAVLQSCRLGPEIEQTQTACEPARLDNDSDVDMDDFGVFQRCYSGTDRPANPSCAGS